MNEQHPSASANPVEKASRIQAVDSLRGMAIGGIFIVNIMIFSGPQSDWSLPSDSVLSFIVEVFFNAKFYPLFSFLFGLGMSLQMLNIKRSHGEFGKLYARRLFWLFVFGALHAVFVWDGDILSTYALLGLILLALRNTQPKHLLILAVIILLARPLVESALMLPMDESSVMEKAMPDEGSILGSGDFSAATKYRLETWWFSGMVSEMAGFFPGDLLMFVFSPFIWLIGFADMLAMFMLGLAAGKENLFQNLREKRAFWKKLFRWTFPAGLVVSLASASWTIISDPESGSSWLMNLVQQELNALTPLLTLGYVSGFLLLCPRWDWLGHLAPVGQMALTNYLLQSLIGTTLFYGYGFGLYGKLPLTLSIFIAVVVYLLQIPFSAAWLRRFRFGPFEWLWRALTYGAIVAGNKK
jgi:uncharacterized protein